MCFDVLDADGVEVDVQMTKDSVLVLFHDAFLNDATNFSGCIHDYNFSDLTELEVYHTKYKLARLDEVIKTNRLVINPWFFAFICSRLASSIRFLFLRPI